MTYILGATCPNGVVLIGDRVIWRGTKFDYEDKLTRPFERVVMGSAGDTGLFDQFLKKLNISVSQKKIKTIPDFLDEVALQVSNVVEINKKITKGEERLYLEVLVAVQNTDGTASELWHIHKNGYRELEKRVIVVGGGEDCGSFFIKELWNENLKMLETADLACFVIKIIEECRLDTSVGGTPQVFIIPNSPNQMKNIKKKELKKYKIQPFYATNYFEKRQKEKVKRLRNFIKKLGIIMKWKAR